MRFMRLALTLLAITLAAGSAFAQPGGHIGLYSDYPGYSVCSLNEILFATNTIYVVHTLAATGNTAQFKIINNWPGPLAGPIDWQSNLTLGDVYTGIAVTYVGCKTLPYLLGTMGFVPLTATPPCTATLEVVADPAVASGHVEVVDCNGVVQIASGGGITINNLDGSCPCGLHVPVASERTNWSRIKALYQ